jgi:hypothetical protein
MQHLEEGTIHAWLDGELAPAERAEAEAHIAECAECAAAVAEARGFIAASSRILTALDSVPGGVLPASSAGTSIPRPAVHRRFMAPRAWMAAAAVLVLSTITVIATRSRNETAQFQVAAATRDEKAPPASAAPLEEKAQEMKPGVRQQAANSDTVETAAPAAPASSAAAPAVAQPAGAAVSGKASAMMQSRADAPADEKKPVDQTERLKSRLEAERQSTRVRSSNGAPPAMADAVPPSSAGEPGAANRALIRPATPPADSVASKDMADKRETAVAVNDSSSELRAGASARGVTITGRVTSEAGAPLVSASVALQGTGIAAITAADGSYALDVPAARANGKTTSLVARLIGYKAVAVPIAPSDAPITHDFVLTANPLALGEVVVTGEGVTSPSERLGAAVASNDAPRLLSRSSSVNAGDTVVTTIYAVRDGTVTLIERSSARDAVRRQKRSADFSDQVMAKARDDARVNSITWSDSSGRTRTLRGAVSRDDLERIRTALFGSTP